MPEPTYVRLTGITGAEAYSDENPPDSLDMTQRTTPTAPTAGKATLWTPDGKSLLMRAPDGVTTTIGPATGGGGGAPWRGKVHTLWGDGNPAQQDINWSFQNTAVSVAAPTPTGVGTTVGRLVSCRYETAITVNTLRYFAVAAVASLYTMAIYNGATGARVWTATVSTAVGWNAINVSATPFTLAADTLYWYGLGAAAAGTTAAFRTAVPPIASSLGLTSLPGNLNLYATRFAQVTLVAGAWPATLPALAAAAFASGGSTGTLPIVFADNA